MLYRTSYKNVTAEGWENRNQRHLFSVHFSRWDACKSLRCSNIKIVTTLYWKSNDALLSDFEVKVQV